MGSALDLKRAPGRRLDGKKDEPEEDVSPSERRLAERIFDCRHNHMDLLAFLSGSVPPWERLTAQVVLARELGPELGAQLARQAFGELRTPFAPFMPPPAVRPGVRARWDLARAQAAVEIARRVPAPLGGQLLGSLPPHVAGAATALSGMTPAGGSSSLLPLVERRAARLFRSAEEDEADPDHPAVQAALAGGAGEPLPETLRLEMEAQLCVNLTQVRVHVNSLASAAARALKARAFTIGEDIFFAEGAFAPESQAGRELLAHELTHVLQSYEGRAGTGMSRPGDSLEREADEAAARVKAAPRGARPNAPLRAPGNVSRGVYRKVIDEYRQWRKGGFPSNETDEAREAERRQQRRYLQKLRAPFEQVYRQLEGNTRPPRTEEGKKLASRYEDIVRGLEGESYQPRQVAGDLDALARHLNELDEKRALPVQARLAGTQLLAQRTAAPRGAGEPLPDELRRQMERGFGADFSGVRVHEDGEAARLGALAFAQGSELHFAPGQYDPSSRAGRELLAHELMHVVQQRRGSVGGVINCDPALEREADQAAGRVLEGERLEPSSGGSQGVAIQRKVVTQDGANHDELVHSAQSLQQNLGEGDDDIEEVEDADLSGLGGEKLYIVCHGNTTSIGDYSPEEFAIVLVERGLPDDVGEIHTMVCSSGVATLTPAPAQRLRRALLRLAEITGQHGEAYVTQNRQAVLLQLQQNANQAPANEDDEDFVTFAITGTSVDINGSFRALADDRLVVALEAHRATLDAFGEDDAQVVNQIDLAAVRVEVQAARTLCNNFTINGIQGVEDHQRLQNLPLVVAALGNQLAGALANLARIETNTVNQDDFLSPHDVAGDVCSSIDNQLLPIKQALMKSNNDSFVRYPPNQ